MDVETMGAGRTELCVRRHRRLYHYRFDFRGAG